MQYVLMHLVVCAISYAINAADTVPCKDRLILEKHMQQLRNISDLILQLPADYDCDLFLKALFFEQDISAPNCDFGKMKQRLDELVEKNFVVFKYIALICNLKFTLKLAASIFTEGCLDDATIATFRSTLDSYKILNQIGSLILMLPQHDAIQLFGTLLVLERDGAKHRAWLDKTRSKNDTLDILKKNVLSDEGYANFKFLISILDWTNLQSLKLEVKLAYHRAQIEKCERVKQAQLTYLDVWKRGMGKVKSEMPQDFSGISANQLLDYARHNKCFHFFIKSCNDLRYNSIDLSSQYISSLVGIDKLPGQCYKLLLSSNKISVVPSLDIFANLDELRLRENKINIFPSVLKTLKKLRILDLEENQIARFSLNEEGFNSVEQLILACNEIASLPAEITGFPTLQNLDLRGNQIKILPLTIDGLENHSQLRSIDLSDNSFNNVQFGPFQQKVGEINPHLRLLYY